MAIYIDNKHGILVKKISLYYHYQVLLAAVMIGDVNK